MQQASVIIRKKKITRLDTFNESKKKKKIFFKLDRPTKSKKRCLFRLGSELNKTTLGNLKAKKLRYIHEVKQ